MKNPKEKKKALAPPRKILYLENDPAFAKKAGYNPYLMTKIQPEGNLDFSDVKFIRIGSSYTACLQITEMPQEPLDFWGQFLVNIDEANVTIDLGNPDQKDAKEKLDRSIMELESRPSKSSEQDIDTVNRHELLLSIQNDVVRDHEKFKEMVIRYFISGQSKEVVDKKIEHVKARLAEQKFCAQVFLNEQEYEMRSITQPLSHQIKNINHRRGIFIPSYALGLSWPLNNSRLDDPHGNLIGVTSSGQYVHYDMFYKSASRKSYDGVVVGNKGSGKSTLLKLLIKYAAIKDNYIRILDCTGEYSFFTKVLGGTVVSMDGSSGRLNLLEIFPGGEKNADTFAQHLSKLNTFLKFVAPDSTDNDRNEFEEYARELYKETGIYDPQEKDAETKQITGLPPEKYPQLSDLLKLIQRDLYIDMDTHTINKNLSESKRNRLEGLELTVRNLVQSYPNLFDGKTTLPNLTDQKVVVYNVQNISKMKDEIFQAQLFNILNLMLSDMVRIGGKSKRQYEAGKETWEVPHLLLVVDEAHRFINTNNLLVLDYMTRILREGRKYFTSLFFASQSIRDFAPEAKEGAGVDKLKGLFEQVQYKFIMQQDSNSVSLLKSVFGDSITTGQLEMIPQFQTGEAVFLTGEDNLHMSVLAGKEDIERFQGGA
ncbi:MAG: DUF87 domain-containing protein [Oscillospiraceae bacterium]|nr:DUF87 domain-containing protein [Oscillospiraceae bacterium]